MSAEGTLSPAAKPHTLRRLATVAIALTLITTAFALGTRYGRSEAAAAVSPDGSRVAFAVARTCSTPPCQTLWIGTSRRDAQRVAELKDGAEACTEIAWSRDGSRVAFLIDGQELALFDANTLTSLGRMTLVQPDTPTESRVARGITFSENGRAVTYDDCPRHRSGCRSGLAAVR